MNYTALIVAAGSGSRMGLGYNKMLYQLEDGKTIVEKTISIFKNDTRCQQIIVVTSAQDMYTFVNLIQDPSITYVQGGDTRQASVFQGLKAVTSEYVFIHDGARPWLDQACLDRLCDCVQETKACLLMVPVKDTIKVVEDGKVIHTPNRATLYAAQTPQAFETNAIFKAYVKADQLGMQATDDAQVMESCGDYAVYSVLGSYENTKVTTKEDIVGK